jgi:hypothetical protein
MYTYRDRMVESAQGAAVIARIDAEHFPDVFPNRVHGRNQIGEVDR